MSQKRSIKATFKGVDTMDGAGVKLKRIFGFYERPQFDPFLLFDHFGSDNPNDYIEGFPWHPHRGIETITYMLSGEVLHEDSLGNKGTLRAGDIQWMTAGSGIVHQEMPQRVDNALEGFQLWANMPAKNKMSPPRYQDIPAHFVPEVSIDGGMVRVLAGEYQDEMGPITGVSILPLYLDLQLEPNTQFTLSNTLDTNCIYIYRGSIESGIHSLEKFNAALFTRGDSFTLTSGSEGAKLLIIGGNQINEKIAWRGPIVMNSDDELITAFNELNNDTFLK
ncbi:MAG: pirin family protein [Fibrobacterales bacterium]